MTNIRKVTVFGGTGFLGRRVVQHLLDRGFAVRVASRHPERSAQVFSNTSLALEFVRADVGDDGSVMTALAGAFGVVNAVSLYVERSSQTFHSVHVEAAARVAKHSRASGVQRLAHVSGIGADARSSSAYIRSRGEGESSVRAAFSAATIIRPAVMFGPDDAFLTSLMKMLQMFPVFPMFGRGRTALQPSYVETRLRRSGSGNGLRIGRSPHLYLRRAAPNGVAHLAVPFGAWQGLAFVAEMMPASPVTRNQVELMAVDNIASSTHPGFRALGIDPRGIEVVLASASKTAEPDG